MSGKIRERANVTESINRIVEQSRLYGMDSELATADGLERHYNAIRSTAGELGDRSGGVEIYRRLNWENRNYWRLRCGMRLMLMCVCVCCI